MRNFLSKTSMLMVAVVVVSGAQAQERIFETNIMTGGPSGTYIKIGKDISDLGANCGENMIVQESAGSLENILAVRERRNTQFGIVQSDVLEYFKKYSQDDAVIQRAIAGVVIAAPLYNEEIQILAKTEIGSLADLAGKRVSVGVENSGTFLTSSLVLDLSETTRGEKVFLSSTDALTALMNDEIDAFFYVAGAPTTLLLNEEIDGEKFHLLPLTETALTEAYTPTQIPAGTYPFQPEAVDLVAVKAVLMTYDYDLNKNAYHAESCDVVSEFSHHIVNRITELRESGHPKWNDVDLADIPPGWVIGSCVNRGLKPEYVSKCVPQIQDVELSEPEANKVYREQICKTLGNC